MYSTLINIYYFFFRYLYKFNDSLFVIMTGNCSKVIISRHCTYSFINFDLGYRRQSYFQTKPTHWSKRYTNLFSRENLRYKGSIPCISLVSIKH